MQWYRFRPYVPVAQRRRRAVREMRALRSKGVDIQPVEIQGRKIAKTFWGEAWCDHLESFSDFQNRLPRGRTYVRNGSVCHLAVAKGKIEAKVAGSEIYNLRIRVKTLPGKKWSALKRRCAGQIGSLLELLQGRLSDHVMEVVADRKNGLFPLPGEISFDCDCPDWAVMCKHVAAVLYGVGARLDEKPQLLFVLRGVNHEELIEADAEKAVSAATTRGKSKRLAAENLSDVFGIDVETGHALASPQNTSERKAKKTAERRSSGTKIAKKRTGSKGAGKAVEKAANRTPKKASGRKPAAAKTAGKSVGRKKGAAGAPENKTRKKAASSAAKAKTAAKTKTTARRKPKRTAKASPC